MGLQSRSENCLMCLKRREQKKIQHSGRTRTCLLGSNFKIELFEGFAIGENTMPLLISKFLQDWSGSVEAFSPLPSFSFFIFSPLNLSKDFWEAPFSLRVADWKTGPVFFSPWQQLQRLSSPLPPTSRSFSGDLVPST
mgnify:CR=1 FL=1